MITKETCIKIYSCHNEIEKALKLKEIIVESIKKDPDKKGNVEIEEWTGNRVGIQMGIPINSGHSIYHVSPTLALSVIEGHINNQKSRLEELEKIAEIELKN